MMNHYFVSADHQEKGKQQTNYSTSSPTHKLPNSTAYYTYDVSHEKLMDFEYRIPPNAHATPFSPFPISPPHSFSSSIMELLAMDDIHMSDVAISSSLEATSSESMMMRPSKNVVDHPIVNASFLSSSQISLDGSNSVLYENRTSEEAPNFKFSMESSFVYRPIGPPLAERMLKALSLMKETSAGGGILAQVWMPIKSGNEYILSTFEQPYLLDRALAGYRDISRGFYFATKCTPGFFPGLPGRVFISKVPEWTSNIQYYHKDEYLRLPHAVDYEVRGSIAMPVFESSSQSCTAILEIVTVKEKSSFSAEIESACRALKAVNLRSWEGHVHSKDHSASHQAALKEIADILRTICHAHKLPLAQTWTHCNHDIVDNSKGMSQSADEPVMMQKTFICVETFACYVNDAMMEGFHLSCAENYLEFGQGLVGRALLSNRPFFSNDVKEFDIGEYPLVHHARRFGLNASVAIRIKSSLTGDFDYVLEFFLPLTCKTSPEQQLLLNNLSTTMQRVCKTLRTISDSELAGAECSTNSSQSIEKCFSITEMHGKISKMVPPCDKTNLTAKQMEQDPSEFDEKSESHVDKDPVFQDSNNISERRRSTAEKNIDLNILQQHFSGSLKDAAKKIGVCPTTLKRICRQHGILRWPSRKINKVNRSLRKLQVIIDSVKGTDGILKFDNVTEGLLVASSTAQAHVSPGPDLTIPSSAENNLGVTAFHSSAVEPLQITGSPKSSIPHGGDRVPASNAVARKKKKNHRTASVNDPTNPQENSHIHIIPTSSSCRAALDATDSHPSFPGGSRGACSPPSTSSSMTDSSCTSGSMMSSNETTSPSTVSASKQRGGILCSDGCVNLTVKATYKADTVRFKFAASQGCDQLFEEVGRRFKLSIGTFQLRYLDDEDEWVMLVNDADLLECLDIKESLKARSLKLNVRDVPPAFGSCSSSSGILL